MEALVLTRMLAVMLVLGTALLGVVASAVVVYALAAGRRRLATRVAVAGAAWLAVYALVVVASPWLYPERLVAPGEERAFCGFDCHLKLAVVHVRADDAPGDSLDWRIRLRARSDARRAPEHPAALVLEVRDAEGGRWPIHAVNGDRPFTRPLLPADTQHVDVVARLPREARALRLTGRWAGAAHHLMPLDENARVQLKTALALEPRS
jgi:hypothetical protein